MSGKKSAQIMFRPALRKALGGQGREAGFCAPETDAQWMSRFDELERATSESLEADPILREMVELDEQARHARIANERKGDGPETEPPRQRMLSLLQSHPLEWLWCHMHARSCGGPFGGGRVGHFDLARWLGAQKTFGVLADEGAGADFTLALDSLKGACARWPRPFAFAQLTPDLWEEALSVAEELVKMQELASELPDGVPQKIAFNKRWPGAVDRLLELSAESLRMPAGGVGWNPGMDERHNPLWRLIATLRNAPKGEAGLGRMRKGLELFFGHPRLNASKLAVQAFALDPFSRSGVSFLAWCASQGNESVCFALRWIGEQGVDPAAMVEETDRERIERGERPLAPLSQRLATAFGPKMGAWALAQHERIALAQAALADGDAAPNRDEITRPARL